MNKVIKIKSHQPEYVFIKYLLLVKFLVAFFFHFTYFKLKFESKFTIPLYG